MKILWSWSLFRRRNDLGSLAQLPCSTYTCLRQLITCENSSSDGLTRSIDIGDTNLRESVDERKDDSVSLVIVADTLDKMILLAGCLIRVA